MRSAILSLILLAGGLAGPVVRAEEAPPACEVPAYLLSSESKLTHVAAAVKAGKPLNVLVLGTRSSTIPSQDGSAYPVTGHLDFLDLSIDEATGTAALRAEFPNPNSALLPGQFVRVRIRGLTLPDAIVVPAHAVSQGPQGPFVYVVGANDIVEERPIRLGPEVPGGWVAESGLKGGERLVTDGVIRVRAGVTVKVRP